MLMLTGLDPRTRVHSIDSRAFSMANYQRAEGSIAEALEQGRASQEPDLGATLLAMDMLIYSVTRANGTRFLWSARDSIAAAAARGDLSVDDYAGFLVSMGEKVVWPEA